jgi:hypothetical protein
LALGQFAGNDKWEAEIKIQEAVLHTRTWKGQNNFSLESFISQHRNAYVSMEACAEHVQYQLPHQLSRVGFLLDAIQSNDAGLHAAIASMRTDDGPNGKRNDFEAAATHLLPYDPVTKKRLSGSKKELSSSQRYRIRQKMTKFLSQQVANHQLARLASTFDTTKSRSTTSSHRNRRMS